MPSSASSRRLPRRRTVQAIGAGWSAVVLMGHSFPWFMRPRRPSREAERHHRLLARRGAVEDPGDPAAAQHQDPVRQLEDLRQVRRHDQHRRARLGMGDQRRVDVALGADVDALGRLLDHEQRRLAPQPFAEQHLLLVAARERPDGPGRPVRLDAVTADQVRAGVPHCLGPHQAPARHAVQVGRHGVVGDGKAQEQAERLAVVGDIAQAHCHRTPQRAGMAPAGQGDPARIRTIEAGEQPGETSRVPIRRGRPPRGSRHGGG